MQPLASIILIITLFAETNRNPFTVAEGESELVAGFMTEYTAMKFAMYFMGEYIAMNTASAVIITMIFGGYNLPYLSTTELLESFSIFSSTLMISIPLIAFIFVKWMRKNNRVRSTIKNDGGRAFETKVLTAVTVIMVILIESILFYLTYLSHDALFQNIAVTLFQIMIFVIKLMMFNIFFIIIRWTLPRFRYDQIQYIGWYYLIPLALLNLFITAIVVVGVS
jgi:NADH-quinone oxidoreductase subunit H